MLIESRKVGHLTCQEKFACWSCLAFCNIDSISDKPFWATLSYSVRSFILLLPAWKLWATKTPTVMYNHPLYSMSSIRLA
jgi:hypothetical protein